MKQSAKLILISIVVMICSAVMMVSCAKTQKKKPDVQRQYTEYEKEAKGI